MAVPSTTGGSSPIDPKRIVADGYDRLGERYEAWAASGAGDVRQRYLHLVLASVAAGAAVLDLGCGSGALLTRHLAERFDVTGVDISPGQIARARQQVPAATFINADMTALAFAPERFDAVVAFYALTHVPWREHPPLLQSIARWLKPGGLFVASLAARPNAGWVGEWLDVEMFFSGWSPDRSRQTLEHAGLEILRAVEETEAEGSPGEPATFFWVVARKPA